MTTQSRVAASGNGAAAAASPDFDLDAPEWYANRELSWLDFNDRVLAEARDRRNPLLERLKFLAITGSNLDEFYAKRIGWLRRLAATDRNQHTLDGMSVTEQLAEAKRRCVAMREEIDELWEHDLRPALAAAGVEIVSYDDLGAERQAELAAHFKQAILPILTPLVVDPAHPVPVHLRRQPLAGRRAAAAQRHGRASRASRCRPTARASSTSAAGASCRSRR